MTVIIDHIDHHADEAVVKRMLADQQTIAKARDHYKALRDAAKEMRQLQKDYFRTKDTRILERSKAAEKQFDELLLNKPKVEQKALFT